MRPQLMAKRPSLLVLLGVCLMGGSGNLFASDLKAILVGDTAMVPLRATFEWLGASVQYEDGRIVATRGGTSVALRVGSRQAMVNGQATSLLAAPTVRDGSAYIPLRFVAESFGAGVSYDATARQLIVIDDGRSLTLPVANSDANAGRTQAKPDPAVQKVFIYPAHGNVFVVYRDGRKAQLTNGGGFEKAELGPDGHTIGWVHGADVWNDGWRSNIWVTDDLTLVRDGRTITRIRSNMGMIWDWKFNGSVAEVALAVGAAKRGVQHFQLVRVSDGRVLDQCQSDFFDSAQGAPRPAWTSGLQDQ